jgi:hypothetical protein
MDPLDIGESSYKEFINCIQRSQHINRLFITNLVRTIVTNDDPFCNSGYTFYVSEGGSAIRVVKMRCMIAIDFWY